MVGLVSSDESTILSELKYSHLSELIAAPSSVIADDDDISDEDISVEEFYSDPSPPEPPPAAQVLRKTPSKKAPVWDERTETMLLLPAGQEEWTFDPGLARQYPHPYKHDL
jgi:hypothetical protein